MQQALPSPSISTRPFNCSLVILAPKIKGSLLQKFCVYLDNLSRNSVHATSISGYHSLGSTNQNYALFWSNSLRLIAWIARNSSDHGQRCGSGCITLVKPWQGLNFLRHIPLEREGWICILPVRKLLEDFHGKNRAIRHF